MTFSGSKLLYVDTYFVFGVLTNIEQTMEVATARVYNWDVTMKRKEKAENGDEEDPDKKGSASG